MKKTIMVVDFVNVAFSSYFGQPLINSYGMNVNAIKGFFFRIRNMLEMFSPDYLVFAEDVKRTETFRRQIFPPYKAQRKPTDPDVFNQFGFIREICIALGFPMIRAIPYEADDICGMVSKFGDDNDFETIIISADRDLYQLVSDKTSICSPKREHEFVDREYILKKYDLLPSQWIDLKMLQGDSSDNIPGIRGIGHKRALVLMHRYGSIENIYKHINELTKPVQEKLIRDEAQLPLLRELVTIVTDYTKISLDEEKLKRGTIYGGEVMSIVQNLDLHSLEPVMWYSLIPYTKGGDRS